MVRRTKEEALVTRDRILDAAELLFEKHGVSRTSLHDIAAAAGVTRGAVYWHFQDKADLFNAMMLRVLLPLEETLWHIDSELDPMAGLRHSFMGALHKTVNDPQVRRVFSIATHKVEYVDELLAVRDRRLATRGECIEEWQRSFALAQRQGLIKLRVPPHAAAVGLHALIDGLIRNWLLDPSAFDLVKLGQQTLDTYLAGLATEPSTKPAAVKAEPARKRATPRRVAPVA
jgi:TetR/AcrR family acrAB operon transcriptional repressor